MDFASITVHNNRWVKPPTFRENVLGKLDSDSTPVHNINAANCVGEEFEFHLVESNSLPGQNTQEDDDQSDLSRPKLRDISNQ